MFPIGVLYAKVRREKYCGTMATLDGLTDGFHADPAKMFVMAYVGQLVRDGFAEWRVLENGHVELWLFSGEVFLLADATIARIM